MLDQKQINEVLKALCSNDPKYKTIVAIPRTHGPVAAKTREQKLVEAAFESCAFKTVMSCVLGKLIMEN